MKKTRSGSCTRSWRGFASVLLILSFGVASSFGDEAANNVPAFKSPISAEESLKHFQLEPGLRIEVVAAEPQVADPVAIAFDEQFRLWVVEMGDYPNGPKPGEQPQSRIRLLEDLDGDGFYETSHLFADHLLFANGVQPWRGGVIVTLSGRVAYFRDTDGDNKADVEETWFTGFAEQNPQLRANHPTFALDNHIYVANGLRGGDVIARKKEWSEGAKPISISGMDFRFDPFTGKYEAVSGNGQFGLTFDGFGNRFVCSNRNPCTHVVLEDRYLKRNPFLAVSSVTQDVSPAGEASKVFPISRQWTTSTLHAGQFTAACGVTIYRGDRLPKEYYGNSFTCEPTGNLVHRDVLIAAGASFTSKPAREGVEFLATRDEWFRPVNLANGPDGSLYVVDMYRAVVEHPEFVPDELKNRPDNYLGNDRGRIYRIYSPEKKRERLVASSQNDSPTSQALLEWLSNPNACQREMARRLILERQDKSLVEPLKKLAQESRIPAASVQALWALEGLGALGDSVISSALKSQNPEVQVQALRLAEAHWKDSDTSPALPTALFVGDARLRFQLALSLGTMRRLSKTALPEVAVAGADDRWTRLAVSSSAGEGPSTLLGRIVIVAPLDKPTSSSSGQLELLTLLGEIVGATQKSEEIEKAIQVSTGILAIASTRPAISEQSFRTSLAIMNGVGTGLARRGGALSTFIERASDQNSKHLRELQSYTSKLAKDGAQDSSSRAPAILYLQYARGKESEVALLELATREADQNVRLQAISALSGFANPEVGKTLLNAFVVQTPAVRGAILETVLADVGRTRMLLDEIEQGRIRPSEIDVGRAARLTKHGDKEIQARATKLFASAAPADRKEVMGKYGKALSLSTDANRGREVFRKNCMTCHRIGEIGVNVAPDIADSRTRTPASLLTDILDPNRAIDNNYFSYTVLMRDGKTHTGIVATETATSITLRQQENKMQSLLRQDIEEMHSNGVSLMPVGLEKNITVEEMADLISFIKNWRYLDGRVPIKVQ